ncbi:MAG: FkbM family methyltransferase [Gammaproteobacteria bacterium]|nr:FkbM family methyltransferase [Gammaproteobacteria bacterium]MDH4315332.1 FkbM family methyltransferase [Gammaproteobacteria bacterium]MDH5215141.1 FkbM family methyltransferase [Gammaproteobacteria bacterium]MDH5501038.1 FkbM family methyltransferase [Gammaproteobacteria bacterium]
MSLVSPLGIDVTERTPAADLRRLIAALKPLEANLIRIGPPGDGGYLLPDDLDGIEYAFSPGVSTQSGFEAGLARRGIKVFMADYSVDGPGEAHANFVFDKKFVGCLSNEKFMTMDEWKQKRIPDFDGDLLLQMDIEGCEYETILSTSSRLLAQFRIIVVEVHFIEQWLCKPHFELVSRAIEKLLQTHSVVHIHPNNVAGSIRSQGLELPRIVEISLQRNDRIRERRPATQFPHPLDADNTDRPSLKLPDAWYR